MKKQTAFIAIVLMVAVCQVAPAAGLNKVLVIGPDPDGQWFPQNHASKLQLRESRELEIGIEIKVPRMTYKDWRGHEFKSENVVYPSPYLSYAERIDDNTVIGIDISTDAANGARFDKISWGMNSKTLVMGTYIRPCIARKVTDRLSVGVGPVFVFAMETWNGPLDINRVTLPAKVGMQAMGIGAGFEIGAMYKLSDHLALGAKYLSSADVDMKGDCRVDIGPVSLKDEIRSKFQFPDHFDFSVGYQPAEDWLIVGQASWFGYSRNSLRQQTVIFNRLPISKSVNLNWEDSYALYLAVAKKFNRWTVGTEVAYASKAIDETADFMTPDIAGFSLAGRLKYSSDDFDLIAVLSRGWGENRSHGKEINIDIWTASLGCKLRF